MTRPELVQLNLSASYLCADPRCNTVSNHSGRCPRCHSEVLSLARVLERLSEAPQEEAAA